ncbi:MAG: hypothetical protein C5B49_03190 [Bdellovibrio sp.]|nr:MAG: hypothetical protein C5B49_03190 [Bdellovibrio sp.]
MHKEVAFMGAPKYADDKGRLALGSEYANKEFLIIKEPNGDVILRPAVTIAANEAWLLKNAKALNLVTRGLDEAREGKFVKSPLRKDDSKWLDEVED